MRKLLLELASEFFFLENLIVDFLRETNRLMLQYGASSIYKLGIGSDDEDDIMSYFKTWKTNIWNSLIQSFSNNPMAKLENPSISTILAKPGAMEEEAPSNLSDTPRQLPYECIISSFKTEKPLSSLDKDDSKYDFKFKNFLQHDTLRILNVTELREHPDPTNFTLLMELLLPKTQKNFGNTDLKYPVSGNIAIIPKNSKKQVQRFLKYLNMQGDNIFSVSSKQGYKLMTPEVVSLQHFAEQYIDLSGRVTEKDYGRLEEMLTEKEWFRVRTLRKKLESEKIVYNILDLFENINITTSDKLSILVGLNKNIKVSQPPILMFNLLAKDLQYFVQP